MISFGYSTLLPLIFFQLLFQALSTNSPVVETEYGKVRGSILKSRNGRDFFSFQGIPFAQPPVGDLRFQDPQKPKKFEGVLDATQPIDDCMQRNMIFNSHPLLEEGMSPQKIIGSEDCLYLNVYTPKLSSGSPLPVMLYIHGGGFDIGSSSSKLHGPELLMDKEIVLVTTNYRLGPMGFLSFEDDKLRGNMGLKDMVASLEWTKENIEKFGGDPDSVTIFGESAGAAAVSLLMSTPKTKGLFHRAITQSGSKNCFWAVAKPGVVRENSIKMAKTLNCPSESEEEMLSCLRKVPAEELISSLNKITDEPMTFAFVPVFEEDHKGAVITKKDLVKPSKIPWMTGFNSGEGLISYDSLRRKGWKNLSPLVDNYLQILPRLLMYKDVVADTNEATEELKKFYFGPAISPDSVHEFVNIASDAFFNFGSYKETQNHKGKLYQYYFNHRGERSFSALGEDGDKSLANHADDLFSIFYMKKLFPSNDYNEEDERVLELTLNLWTNFATFEDPTPPGRDLRWKLNTEPDEFFEINSINPGMIQLPIMERMRLWEKLTGGQDKHTEL